MITSILPILIGAQIAYNTSPLPGVLAKQITTGITLVLCVLVIARGLGLA